MDKCEAIQTGIFKIIYSLRNLRWVSESTAVYLGAAILFNFPIPGICDYQKNASWSVCDTLGPWQCLLLVCPALCTARVVPLCGIRWCLWCGADGAPISPRPALLRLLCTRILLLWGWVQTQQVPGPVSSLIPTLFPAKWEALGAEGGAPNRSH